MDILRAATVPDLRSETARRAIGLGVLVSLSFGGLVFLVQRLDAVLALGIPVLLVAGVAMLARPGIATVLTVFLIYINFPAILTKQHGMPHVVAGSFVILLAFPLLHFLIIRRESLRADLTFYLMLLLLGVYLVGALVAKDTGVALATVREYVLEGLLLYWLIFNVVRSIHTLRRVIWTILLAGGLLSGLAIYQTVTGSYTREFGGLAYRDFELIQDQPERDGPERRRTWDRARGPLDEPNRFAQILLVLVPLAAFMARTGRTPAARLGAAGCGLLIVGGVLTTLSRGGFLTLLLLALVMVAVRWLRVSRVLAFALIVAMAAPSVPFFVDRMTATGRALGLLEGDAPAASQELDSAARIRMTVMLAAGHVFLDHPILGVGPGQFGPFYSQPYSRNPDINTRELPPGNWRAHSLYLEIAAEAGIVGLSIFLGIVVVLLRRLWALRSRWLHENGELADLAMAFGLSLIAYQVSGIFLHLSYQPYYWFLLALTGAAVHLMATVRQVEPLTGASRERPWLR